MAWRRLCCHRYDEAAAAFRDATQKGGPPVAFANLALTLVRLGRKDEAIAAAHTALTAPNRSDWQPGFVAWSDGIAAWALAEAGASVEAEAVVRRLEEGPEESRCSAGFALAVLGRRDESAAALAKMQAFPCYRYFLLNDQPALRADPRIIRSLTEQGALGGLETYERILADQRVKR